MLAAQSFTGTWKADITTVKRSGKPSKVELSNGSYKCLSCNPPYTVKADGKDQALSGVPGIDTRSHCVVSSIQQLAAIPPIHTTVLAVPRLLASVHRFSWLYGRG
jgi:hypothetical protein